MKLTMKNARLIYDMRVRDGETRCFESWLLHELETCANQRDAVTAERDRAREELAEANKIIDMKINTNRHLSEMNAYLAKKCDMKEPTHD